MRLSYILKLPKTVLILVAICSPGHEHIAEILQLVTVRFVVRASD